ncbi:uncharacterized protein UV8b_07506 [Ustilaginoidea virens]|uniref:Mitochondrial outer membrane protein n=1 Tax=Ustilaginoidea virens TaxID=1159556 RepID=A0A8E5HXM1_USTVR|nr:uncharacterized protein UV8b_07506 [Ustilaginoidea virens]QUC23265.1 hypothetical protein UV8b_07506 [Ustilaginoidea virens]
MPDTWLAVPPPVRTLFQRFPLVVHPAEPLPARAPDHPRRRPKLHVFATDHDALRGLPSYNPTCLKWQTLLRIARIPVDLVPSNNHASPSGALPFLLPASSDPRPDIPLTGRRILHYAERHCPQAAATPRQEAYLSLLAQSIRPAWLYTLYVDPTHTDLLARLYLPAARPTRGLLLRSLRSAAADEVRRTTRRPLLQPEPLYADAERAFAALSAVLGRDEWFFGARQPGLFDADVFAYTYLILDGSLGWRGDALRECVSKCGNLVRHRDRLFQRCWGWKVGHDDDDAV